MLEDALKSTRNLHRLIMTVCLATLIFSMSLNLPQQKAQQRAIIGTLLSTDFMAYQDFVEREVTAFSQTHLAPVATSFDRQLAEASNHMVFLLDDISEALADPIHVGRFLIEDSILSNPAGASLSGLASLNGLSLFRDVQVLVPELGPLMPRIDEFLDENTKTAGKRINEVRVQIDESDFLLESFLPGEKAFVYMYFELVDSAPMAAPVFEQTFDARIETIEGTSFSDWIANSGEITNAAVTIKNNRVEFAPGLQDTPQGFREEPLGPLHKQLYEEIERASPNSQSVTILGTEVPGLLVILASPLTLLVLCYYFANHSRHLRRVGSSDPAMLIQFAWMPLAYGNNAWWMESAATLILLPIIALFVLQQRLAPFNVADLSTTLLLVGAMIAISVCGALSLANIRALRAKMDAHRSQRDSPEIENQADTTGASPNP